MQDLIIIANFNKRSFILMELVSLSDLSSDLTGCLGVEYTTSNLDRSHGAEVYSSKLWEPILRGLSTIWGWAPAWKNKSLVWVTNPDWILQHYPGHVYLPSFVEYTFDSYATFKNFNKQKWYNLLSCHRAFLWEKTITLHTRFILGSCLFLTFKLIRNGKPFKWMILRCNQSIIWN